MIRKDFLVRQAEELGKVLGQLLVNILGLKSNASAWMEIDTARQTLIGELDLDIEHLAEIPSDQFISILQKTPAMDDKNLDQLANILFQLAEKSTDMEKALIIYGKCLLIYEYLEESSPFYSFDRQVNMEKIRSLI